RRGLQILPEQSTQHGAGAFGTFRWEGHVHLRPAQCAIAVGSEVQGDRSGRTIGEWSQGQLLLRGELLVAGHLSLQVQGVEREAKRDQRQHREHHQDAPAHGLTSGSLARTAATPAAIDCATCSWYAGLAISSTFPAGGAISTAMAWAAILFIGRSGASSVALGSLRDSSSAATEPATVPLKSRNAACAVSHGRKPCGERLAAGSIAVNTWTPCPVLAACSAM